MHAVIRGTYVPPGGYWRAAVAHSGAAVPILSAALFSPCSLLTAPPDRAGSSEEKPLYMHLTHSSREKLAAAEEMVKRLGNQAQGQMPPPSMSATGPNRGYGRDGSVRVLSPRLGRACSCLFLHIVFRRQVLLACPSLVSRSTAWPLGATSRRCSRGRHSPR